MIQILNYSLIIVTHRCINAPLLLISRQLRIRLGTGFRCACPGVPTTRHLRYAACQSTLMTSTGLKLINFVRSEFSVAVELSSAIRGNQTHQLSSILRAVLHQYKCHQAKNYVAD